ncbi:MAG TPA: hypothetical protein VNT03_06860, partial [Baekduia sp.]|nr:hypothetical protein [Baekduia sp.]
MRLRRHRGHYWQAVLDGDRSPQAAAHLERCGACRTRVEAIGEVTRAARAQAPPLPPGLDA